MSKKAKPPAWPISLDIAPYRQTGEPGHPCTPLTREAIERETAERACLGRFTLIDATGAKASVFLSVQLVRGGIMFRAEQDQTDYDGDAMRLVRREFRLKFFK